MTENIYKAPQAELLEGTEKKPVYYVVSIRKFLILYFATLGLYSIYWFYQHWQTNRIDTGERIWPVPRSIFSIFFAHSLFSRFDTTAKEVANPYDWSATGVASLFVLFTLVQTIGDRLADKSIGEPYTSIISFASMFIVGWTLYKAQQVANYACLDPAGKSNSQITLANAVWIFLGAILWLTILLGLYEIMFGLPVF